MWFHIQRWFGCETPTPTDKYKTSPTFSLKQNKYAISDLSIRTKALVFFSSSHWQHVLDDFYLYSSLLYSSSNASLTPSLGMACFCPGHHDLLPPHSKLANLRASLPGTVDTDCISGQSPSIRWTRLWIKGCNFLDLGTTRWPPAEAEGSSSLI